MHQDGPSNRFEVTLPLRGCAPQPRREVAHNRRRSVNALRIAQVNIGRMKAALEDPVMAGFVARLEEINALADRSPGFIWRLQTSEGDAGNIERSNLSIQSGWAGSTAPLGTSRRPAADFERYVSSSD